MSRWADGQVLADVAKLVGIKQASRVKLSGMTPDRPLIAEELEGLPMPENVYDDQFALA
jgi:hypothetical protein